MIPSVVIPTPATVRCEMWPWHPDDGAAEVEGAAALDAALVDELDLLAELELPPHADRRKASTAALARKDARRRRESLHGRRPLWDVRSGRAVGLVCLGLKRYCILLVLLLGWSMR